MGFAILRYRLFDIDRVISGPCRTPSCDRRLNRGRYDAAATVAAFAERLRDTVSLDDVRADLMTVVEGP